MTTRNGVVRAFSVTAVLLASICSAQTPTMTSSDTRMSKPTSAAWRQDCMRFASPDREACQREQAAQQSSRKGAAQPTKLKDKAVR